MSGAGPATSGAVRFQVTSSGGWEGSGRSRCDRSLGSVGALVVSSTPYGTAADHTAIAEICHARGKPLIVDEAWGAHLPFHDHLPTWAMDACGVPEVRLASDLQRCATVSVRGRP